MGQIRTASDVTPEWLGGVLGGAPVVSVEATQIGTGQMSENYRLAFTRDDGAQETVVLKVAASDEQSRATGLALGLYEREVRFYAEVAPLIGGPIAPCLHHEFDPETGQFALLIGDAGPAEQGDEVQGTSIERARLAMAELGRLHGPVLGSASLADAEWLNRDSPLNQALVEQLLAGFVERYADRISPAHQVVATRYVACFDASLEADRADTGPRGLIHGDYRLDNLLFGDDTAPRPLTVVDWQTVAWGPAFTDVAYFLGCALTVADRRAHADELLEIYHAALGPDTPVTLEEVREGVRRTSFFGVMMAVISPMLVQRTDRGDDMFMAVFERHCAQVLDLDALETLPEPTVLQPLAPDPEDEHPHAPGPEALWNESWYFDVADPEQGIGAYFRLGLEPNRQATWHTTLICGPGRPTAALVDFKAPLPGPDLHVSTATIESTQAVEQPLQRYRVHVKGTGAQYADPAALLTEGAAGEPVEIELDLTWHTAGTPFRYRMATRYEIPCTVDGTLRVGEETWTLTGAAGQRDHSWGVRDWWSMDWVWSAFHLDDGTHTHGVDLRLPELPRMGTGYVQRDGEIQELSAAAAEETLDPDGLGNTTTLTMGDVTATIEPQGHGPLRLVDDDGRVALFPRAWGPVTTADGRTGVGWIEWNVG